MRKGVIKPLVEREGVVCLDDLCDRFALSLEEAIFLSKRLDRTWDFSFAVIDLPVFLKKKLGVICKKGNLGEALKTLRDRVKTRVAPKNLRVVNSPPKKTRFVTAYDLWKQKNRRFEKDRIYHKKL